MAVKLFDRHEPKCEYCVHVRAGSGQLSCVRRKGPVQKPCGAFCYDPLKRVPRQEARLPQYKPEDFAIDRCDTEGDLGYPGSSDGD